MKPDTHHRFASLSSGDSTDHWADELPRDLTLEAAELIEIPYTFLRHRVLAVPSPWGPSC
ncbi:hypothetical protein [Cupriavidus lacunae]|uniref:Uncharacterized protein n=1 Tax=Cupriavidus lacunae TaxID=2666307 RepID=A0A370NSN3_9BURK|nr:hypothetical protein [Cupriavidus lacunae]RDK08601.1 hypothetical protein DN412_19480 [Cupriavidus lacunae]